MNTFLAPIAVYVIFIDRFYNIQSSFSLSPAPSTLLGLPGVLVPLLVLLPPRLQDLLGPLDFAVPPVLLGERGLHHRRMPPRQSRQLTPPLRYLGGVAAVAVLVGAGGLFVLNKLLDDQIDKRTT